MSWVYIYVYRHPTLIREVVSATRGDLLCAESYFSEVQICPFNISITSFHRRQSSEHFGAVPEHESYSSFKEANLKRTGRLDENLKRELFNNVTKYDRALSQLLRYIKSRLGKYTMAEPILRDL